MLASAVTLCCDEYNTYTTLSEEFRVVFRFTHTSTFELIPVASAYQKPGDNWWRIRATIPLPLAIQFIAGVTYDVCIFHLFAILLHSLLCIAALSFEGARDRQRDRTRTFFLYERSVIVVWIALRVLGS